MNSLRRYFHTFRTALAVALAYALVLQGFAAPLAHAKSIESARLEAAFAIICADEAPVDHGKSGPVHSALTHDCCLGAQRYALELPFVHGLSVPAFLPVVAVVSFKAPMELPRPVDFDSPTNLSPRGPPSFA